MGVVTIFESGLFTGNDQGDVYLANLVVTEPYLTPEMLDPACRDVWGAIIEPYDLRRPIVDPRSDRIGSLVVARFNLGRGSYVKPGEEEESMGRLLHSIAVVAHAGLAGQLHVERQKWATLAEAAPRFIRQGKPFPPAQEP